MHRLDSASGSSLAGLAPWLCAALEPGACECLRGQVPIGEEEEQHRQQLTQLVSGTHSLTLVEEWEGGQCAYRLVGRRSPTR